MDEAMWTAADSIGALTEVEPVAGRAPAGRTIVRVLTDADRIVIGVRADDPNPDGIVSFARERDNSLANEDHIKIVLDTYLDGRSGYVFAVNPNGARYDALISGDGENANWDAVWDAATVRTATGWSAEIVIPIRSVQFASGLTTWGFNVQRRVQRLLENDRWASPVRDFKITQTFRAGRLTNLPPFALGLGLSVRPSLMGATGVPAPGAVRRDERDMSLDITQTLGASTLAALTVNTDFAETEVDTRRTNLTRFPIVFPEKRTFFLQGADIFDFGLSLGDDVRPFFSRRIGLLSGNEVPIRAGVKVTGRANGANVGAIALRTGDLSAAVTAGTTLPSTANTLGVLRYKQNIGRESTVGMIGTIGDPTGRANSWMGGLDATYQTSRFHGNKNLAMGVWGLQTDRDGLTGEKSAWGAKIDYPNDLWQISATYKRIGDGFDPSLGFVPRAAAQIITFTSNFVPRPRGRVAGLRVRQMVNEFQPRVVTDLNGKWESYRIFMAPVNWRLESGDRFELNVNPTGERLAVPFTIAPGVTIPAGAYHWNRYRVEGGLAAKRRFSGQATWWFGPFYTGRLDEITLTTAWKPSSLFNVEVNGTRNIGRLREGGFTQDLIGTRLRVNVSSNLQLNSYAQYDNQSDTFGANTRIRWTFSPLGDLFIVYNHNLRHDINGDTGLPYGTGLQTDPTTRYPRNWGFASNQLLVKLQYAFRY
ncbi:carbohydrate binding family 9 domain-containing protein [Gemmatimonas groenlandica]|uniref:Carbohydrate binding family 9 domain-containing protein n=1 Tax=Gemmatimonas groenlandica TaxID=2732249 RepID=A0A6M4IME2_9BACT|nr:carbohydrate binding family 9 domain-containing protein [Gemmatimonas groenlandica]QJR34627.1 carbohydrate binding family 9 domain-containing protein [Gemmatimonas groenlandica]